MYRIAIRGIPHFGYLQYIDVNDVADVFTLYDIRVKDTYPHNCDFYLKNSPKRVLLYLDKTQHEQIVIDKYCKDSSGDYICCMRPRDSNPLEFGGGGSGSSLPFLMINPECAPDYPELLEIAKTKRAQKIIADRKQREAEEERERVLADALEQAVDRAGYDRVLDSLNNM